MNHQNHQQQEDHSMMDMDHQKMNHSMSDSDMSMMDHSHMNHGNDFKKRFFISLVLAIPVLVLSPMMGIKLPFQFTFPGSAWVVLILSTILYFYGGKPFLFGAKKEIENRNPAMMTLISLGITVAYFYSLYAFISTQFLNSSHVMDFFWELASLIVIMLLGHWIEMNAVQGAGNALESMAKLLPTDVQVVSTNGEAKTIPLKEVTKGMTVMVKAGDKVPVDGIILTGSTTVNESMVTGESKDISKTVKDKVIGGSINGSGVITVQVTGTGESGYLSQIMKLVQTAQQEKSKIETRSDKVAKWLFYIALFVGIAAFIVWFLITKDFNIALQRMVTVFVIACPHALGLAIPLVVARSTSIAAKNGLLIKNREALETVNKIDYMMMDKTGTLTEGNFSVIDIISLDSSYSKQQILAYAGALESHSNHPLAIGIQKMVQQEAITLPEITAVTNIAGVGLTALLAGKEVALVSVSYLDKNNLDYNQQQFQTISGKGYSISYLLFDKQVIGLISQGDKIKENAKEFINKLKEQAIQPIMLTGDNQLAARQVAKELGIEKVEAELLPNEKEQIIQDYQKQGYQVAMVGDGINDAPSLIRADIGIAIGAGTDVAIDSADVILVKSDPLDILCFLTLAKKTSAKMVQNLWWGAGYNIIAIPLAAGVLAFANIILTPAVGSILMSLSTIIVAVNSMTLHIDK